MTQYVTIDEMKSNFCALLAEVEAGEDLVICRDAVPVAHVTRVARQDEHATLSATLWQERAKQTAVTTSEILAWRHAGHTR